MPVKTETVTVRVPVYVQLPSDLLTSCTVTVPSEWTNGTLAQYAIDLSACLSSTNDKLTRIKGLQP